MGCDVFLHPSQRHHRSHPRTFYDAAVWDWGIGLHRIREEEKNPEVKQRRTLWNTLLLFIDTHSADRDHAVVSSRDFGRPIHATRATPRRPYDHNPPNAFPDDT